MPKIKIVNEVTGLTAALSDGTRVLLPGGTRIYVSDEANERIGRAFTDGTFRTEEFDPLRHYAGQDNIPGCLPDGHAAGRIGIQEPDSDAWRPDFRVRARYWISWILVRPRRWLFHRMIRERNVRWVPRRTYPGGPILWPNLHWWALYMTVFRAFNWLRWGGWRLFAKVDDMGCYGEIPWYARAIRRIGETTAGMAQSGGECWHCASTDGDPVHLSEDETGETFELLDSGPTWSDWGSGHWFRGITTCPRCGYRREYDDSSP